MSGPRMGALVWVGKRLIYPGILGGSALGVALLSERVPVVVAMGVVNVLAGAAILAAEAALPYRGSWQGAHGDVATDLGYLAMTGAALVLAGTPLMAAFGAAAAWLARNGDGTLWPAHWPRLLQLALALLVYELGSYSFHRLCHHTRLWRLHSVHHSVLRLHGLNAIRSHPIDLLLAVATTSGPLLLLGVDERLFAQVTVIGTVNMWLQHANADLRTGWLDWVFVTPNIHRWHHSTQMREQQHNLGANLVFWDVVFRTRLAPPDRAPPEQVGTGHDRPYPESFLGQLLAPFTAALWR
jgi:sterol desaturase/sphingolipid hydroxylase (fatty acid hydroxylase superfamily)